MSPSLPASPLVGADAAELERIARSMRQAADELDDAAGSLTASLVAVEWVGWVATRFGIGWNGRHRPRMAIAAEFVRGAAVQLERHAAEQRAASVADVGARSPLPAGPGGGESIGSAGNNRDEHGELDRIDGLIDSLGLGRDLLELLGEHATALGDTGPVKRLVDLLGGDEFGAVLQTLEPVLDVGTAVVHLVTDFVEHPDLPFDERIVHALVDMGTRIGLDQGVELGASALAAMLMPMILPGLGATLSPLVGKGVGIVVGEAMDLVIEMIDGGTDIVDHVADVATDRWRELSAQFGLVYDIIGEPVIAIVGEAADLGGDVAGALVDAGDAAVGAVGGVIGSINPWD